MTFEELQLVRLSETSPVSTFDCGDTDLNDFLFSDAMKNQNQLLTVTYILLENDIIVGYFSVLNDKVSIFDFSEDRTLWNRFRKIFRNRKRISSYPSIKVGRFAISKKYQSTGVGTALIDFIKEYFIVNNKSGCVFVTVDAYNAAIPFYIKNGFSFLSNYDDRDSTRLMYFDLRTIL